MKRGDGSNDAVVSAAVALFIVLLGCLAISAQCARTLDHAGGGSARDEAVAASGVAPPQKPYCYRSCSGYEPCTYCCGSDFTPTVCWKTMDKCTQECHLPWSAGPPTPRTGAAEAN